MLGKQLIQAAAGAAGAGGAGLYVDDVFSTYLYTGNNTTNQISNGIDLAGEGGLVWLKSRNSSAGHFLYDTLRGRTVALSTNTTNPNDGISSTGRDLASFDATGFTLGQNQYHSINNSGDTFASWSFRKAPGFFDVVTYTGSGSGTKTISHNLGSVPGMIIVKGTNAGSDWSVYHRSLNGGSSPENYYLTLNSTAAQNSNANWGSTAPTATEFTVGGNTNASINYVAYIFAHDDAQFGTDSDESIIKCGSFTAGSHTESLGFEPQFLLAKRTDNTSDWFLVDSMRGFYPQGTDSVNLRPNTSNDENTAWFHLTADGFYYSSSAAPYIYMAIRRPHKPPTAGTEVYKSVAGSDAGSTATGFTVDMALSAIRSGSSFNHAIMSRLQPDRSILSTYRTSTEEVNFTNAGAFATNDGMKSRALWGTSIYHFFKRAPGFMDVVAYTGTNSNGTQAVSHNLEATPELIIVKNRSTASFGDWRIWSSYLSTQSHQFKFTSTAAENVGSFISQNDSSFTIAYTAINQTGVNFISYLFATLSGISKVGTFSGTGNAINVDCGFSSGARFILIKRTDATGDWFVYDSARGIVSGNDPYLLLNSNAAEVTNTDYIDPLNSGFTVTSSAPTGLNASGGTYIFLAIA
jgi:hypothetical protein